MNCDPFPVSPWQRLSPVEVAGRLDRSFLPNLALYCISFRSLTPARKWRFLSVGVFLVGLTRLPAAPATFHAAVLSDAPVLHYRFSETDGPAINYGTLGAGFNAAYFGTPLLAVPTSAGDTGVSFDGPDDYLESASTAPAFLSGNPTFSAEAIVFVPATGSAALWAPFLHWGVSEGTSEEKSMKSVYFSFSNNDPTRIFAGFYNGGLRTSAPVTSGQWHHVVWVRQGGNPANLGTRIYVDGAEPAMEGDPALPANSGIPTVIPTAFRINRAQDFTRFFTGFLDEVALYDRALTPAEVKVHSDAAFDFPELSITAAGPAQVRVSWLPAVPGFVLQESTGLTPQSWMNSPSGFTNPVLIQTTPPRKFFRLFKP